MNEPSEVHKHYHLHLWPSGKAFEAIGTTIVLTIIVLAAFTDII